MAKRWFVNIKTAPIAERIRAVKDRMETWVAARMSLDNIEPSAEAKQVKLEWLKQEYGLVRKVRGLPTNSF